MDEINLSLGKHNLIIIGKRRYYDENLNERDFHLENTTPYLLRIGDYEIQEGSWVEMIRNLSAFLVDKYPSLNCEIIDFRTDWSKSAIFSNNSKTNYKKVMSNVYVNCNHTALHSCWLIQDILRFYKINLNEVKLYIHRPSSAEPVEVKDYFLRKARKEFLVFLMEAYDKTHVQGQKIISNISNYMNPILKKLSKSYDDLFLFDDYATAINYIAKEREYINAQLTIPEKNKVILNRYCNYLQAFYKI